MRRVMLADSAALWRSDRHCVAPTSATVLLTPGVYNSAYFEHTFLAQQMGIELVRRARSAASTAVSPYADHARACARVDVIYRRIDDDFLDPLCFRPIPPGRAGLIDAYRRRQGRRWPTRSARVWPTTKRCTPRCRQIIRYYLGEEPILPNVPTYVCSNRDQRDYVLEHLDEFVVKAADESGGYGMLIGPQAQAPPSWKPARLRSRRTQQLHRPTDVYVVHGSDVS